MSRNGNSPTVIDGEAVALLPSTLPTGPRMPRRHAWLDLPAEYGEAGMKVYAWVNYPTSIAKDIDSGDPERVFPALSQVILEHNGWLTEESEPLPAANTREFWEEISTELSITLLRVISLESHRLPSSLERPRPS